VDGIGSKMSSKSEAPHSVLVRQAIRKLVTGRRVPDNQKEIPFLVSMSSERTGYGHQDLIELIWLNLY
jgi:hypothetical protein